MGLPLQQGGGGREEKGWLAARRMEACAPARVPHWC